MEDTLGGRLAPEASAPERHLVREPARRYTGDPCQEWADEEQHHGARGEGDDRCISERRAEQADGRGHRQHIRRDERRG